MSAARIAVEGRTCWRRARTERLAFLIDGSAYFDALAAAIERARRQVLIVGWDVHSRMRLRRSTEPPAPGALPSELAPWLDALVRRRPRLHIHVLDWNYSIALALDREWLPVMQLDWRTHRRVEFLLDAEHPVGACHHQKLVVVDDRVAFVGGNDLTLGRWDSPEHAPGDPRRVEVDGAPYDPFHDVQMIVEGEAAAALGALARERWRRASGRRLRRPRGGSDPWPAGLACDLEGAEIAIARTEPAHDGRPAVREVEALFVASIAAAQRYLYVENQYLTSATVCTALAERLREPNGPEVVIVGPRTCSGWLERRTMGVLRADVVEKLRAADGGQRLRLLCPVQPGLGAARLNVHSKVMIGDDRFARVGSANLSNRSMGFDTECDLFLEDDGRSETRAAIAGLRDRLLAEHLGATPEKVAAALAETGSLVRAVEALGGGRSDTESRTLAPLDCSVEPDGLGSVLPLHALPADPIEPFAAGTLFEKVLREEALLRRPIAQSLGALLALWVLAGAWRLALLLEWTTPGSLAFVAARAAESGVASALAAAALALAAWLPLGFGPLALASALVLGPARGCAVVVAAAGLSALLAYASARLLGRRLRAWISGRLHAPRRFLERPGARASAALRWAARLPFALANLLSGALRVPVSRFGLGLVSWLVPNAAAYALLSIPAGRVLRDPDLASSTMFLAFAFPLALAGALVRRALRNG